MRNNLLRLGGAILLVGSTAAASPQPFSEGSAVIVQAERVISSNRINTGNGSDAPLALWSYDAEFTVTNQLAGPDLGKTARISFIDQRQSRSPRLFMIVHRDGVGRLWARRAWQEVGNQLCLSAEQVSSLRLDAAFSDSRDNSDGERCINV